MSILDTLITDRQESDALNNTPKTFISYEDMNRIEGAVQYLSDYLKEYNYLAKVTTKTDWKMSDIRSEADCERIKENYNVLKRAYYNFGGTPLFKWATLAEANRIEQILEDIGKHIRGMEQVFVYCGVANVGQPRLWQQRFRRKYLTERGYTAFVDADGNEFVTADDEELYVKE